jgi:hypothetical protein
MSVKCSFEKGEERVVVFGVVEGEVEEWVRSSERKPTIGQSTTYARDNIIDFQLPARKIVVATSTRCLASSIIHPLARVLVNLLLVVLCRPLGVEAVCREA